MIKTFKNPNNLSLYIIVYRLVDLDPTIIVRTISNLDFPKINPVTGAPLNLNYVSIESTLTDVQIKTALATPQTQAEINAFAVFVGARASMKAIPFWATWTEAEALSWEQTNIGTRIIAARSELPATLTMATTRTAILGLITILDNVQLLLVALIRMIVAIRNKVF